MLALPEGCRIRLASRCDLEACLSRGPIRSQGGKGLLGRLPALSRIPAILHNRVEMQFRTGVELLDSNSGLEAARGCEFRVHRKMIDWMRWCLNRLEGRTRMGL